MCRRRPLLGTIACGSAAQGHLCRRRLSAASRRVSTYAADHLGLAERGRLVPGAYADLAVLDRDLQLNRVYVEGKSIELAHAG